jgi:hypothetical protein
MPYLSVGDLATQLNASPTLISNLIYRDEALRKLCPLTSGRRQVPLQAVEKIVAKLKRRQPRS